METEQNTVEAIIQAAIESAKVAIIAIRKAK